MLKKKKRKEKLHGRDFPGGPVVKISPSNTGDVVSIPRWGAKISYASGPIHIYITL